MNRRTAYTALLSAFSAAVVRVSPAKAKAPTDSVYERSNGEINADVEPTNLACAFPDARRYGELILPPGLIVLSSMMNIPNRVRIRGANKRGTVLQAASAHSGPYMFFANNGTSSMFDCALEELTLDCNMT